MARAVSGTVNRCGRLDAAHDAAGVAAPFLPPDGYPPEECLRVLQVDLISDWHCLRAEPGCAVNVVAPGVTRTGMTSAVSADLLQRVPLSRIAEPDEIAAVAVWLCSAQASYVTGSILIADGGWLAG